MKRLLTVILMAVLALPFIACSGDHAEDEAPAIYYVKYEAKSARYILENVYVETEKGTEVFQCSSMSFSQIFGPVSKGFIANIRVRSTSPYAVETAIYVCRGEEPFALKATGGRDASYQIDF